VRGVPPAATHAAQEATVSLALDRPEHVDLDVRGAPVLPAAPAPRHCPVDM